jgi:hypothetical protein
LLIGCVVEAPDTVETTQSLGLTKLHTKPGAIADEYIVVLAGQPHAALAQRAQIDAAMDAMAARHGATIRKRYSNLLRGFSARMTASEAALLAQDPDVLFVEQNGPVHASAVQNNATYSLDRIDQRNLPLDTKYNFTTEAQGTTVFVIDTGIRTTHVEFTGRINLNLAGTAIDDGFGVEDCNGHGTHVAGSVGGTLFGVAKKATLVPIRVLDCNGSGSNEGVIAGMDFVAANHPAKSVVNMSLGGPASAATDAAVRNLVANGVTVVVAAGNENQDACNTSPAREPMAITVASSTNTDVRSSFSNFGSCVDIFAPGSDITSAWIDSDTSINTISGTSMASPHVAGAAALFLAQNAAATPAQVTAGLIAASTTNKLTNVSGSPNRLLHTLFGNAPPPPPPPSPVNITSPADGAEVQSMFVVTADAPDAVSVELLVNNMHLVTDDAAPFASQITNAPPGTYVVEVIATDANGGQTSDAVTVKVKATGGGNGSGGGLGGGNNPPPPPPPMADSDDPGGCSSTHGGSQGVLALLALLALALPQRRSRRA